jgi:ABC-2 type transport system permease protein
MIREVARPWAVGVVWIFWKREVLRYLRDRSQAFGGVSRTVLWLLILGHGLGASFRDIEGYTYSQYVFPGVMVLNVLFAGLQSAIVLVWDREVGLLRAVLVSPAPMLAVALGKLLGGATVALIQGSIPLLFAPLVGVSLSLKGLLLAWLIVFTLGIMVTGFGVVLASRMRNFEGFGSISNGVIQPLYFLSGSIFPLKGVVGGVGFLDIPEALRAELERLGIHTIGGGWVVELPLWLKALVYANPISYALDLLRYVTLGYAQLPLGLSLGVMLLCFVLASLGASWAMGQMRKG